MNTRRLGLCFVTLIAYALQVIPSNAQEPRASVGSVPSLEAAAIEARSALAPGEDWLDAVRHDLRLSEYRYAPRPDGFWSAPNRAHDLRSLVTADGIEVVSRSLGADEAAGGWLLRLTLTGYGRGMNVRPVEPAALSAAGDRVTMDRGSLIEWYANDERGVEQGFTLPKPPQAAAEHGPVVLTMKLGGGLLAYPTEDGQSVLFKTGSGEPVLRYGELQVRATTGEAVPARLAASPGRLEIRIDDRGAVYPLHVDPLMTSPAWSAESDQASASFGYSVGTAGDVNGDGYSDVIVGAYQYDNGQTDEGRAYVYLGSPSGPAATPAWTVEGDQGNASFGYSVATAGDVNGDGYADVIVGAYQYDNGQVDEGRAYVYLGSPSGLAATSAWTAEGDQGNASFGYSVATAGDVNGDGYADVIVGANAYDNGQPDEGRAFVYFGSASGLAATPVWTAESDQAGAYFGESVAGAGDGNGDGYADVIVGAPRYGNGEVLEGRAHVYLGSASGPVVTPGWTGESNQAGAQLGISVSAAGDVNGDGYADVIVGAFGFDNGQSDEGRALVYLGSASGLAAAPSWAAEGDQATAYFGGSVATAGDVNGDGFADVIVGAWLHDNGASDEGRAYVYLGSPSGPAASPAWTAESDQSGARMGRAVATAGDVDGDGYSDVIVGAVFFDNGEADEGRAFVYRGSAAALAAAPAWTTESDQNGSAYGFSVAGAGDVNGDGYSDVVIGAILYDRGQGQQVGRAYLYLGSPSGPAATPAWLAEGDQPGDEFGRSVATAGDVSGDGYSDVIVGVPRSSRAAEAEGRALVYLGSASGLAATPAWTAEGDQLGDEFGRSVATAGDVNGDGFSDVVVGVPGFDRVAGAEGRALVYLGSASGLAATPAWTAHGSSFNASFGDAVATAGDVNGDGYSDVIVGAPGWDGGLESAGRAYVFLGSGSGLRTTPAWNLGSNQENSFFGDSVASAGDVNGDGYSDIIVGAPDDFNALDDTGEGRALVYLGSAAGLATTPAWTVELDEPPDTGFASRFGDPVAAAGDVNGDGFSDIIVGAGFYDQGTQDDQGRTFVYLGSAAGPATTPAWIAQSNQRNAYFGLSAGSAGDTNGDGYSDVIVGARNYGNDQGREGRAFVYYGNQGDGLDRIPRQALASGTAPIDLLGRSDVSTSFRLRGVGRNPGGRGRVRMQGEVKRLGVAFDGSGLVEGSSQDTGAPGFSGSSVGLDEIVAGLEPGRHYHWRMRLATDSPFFPRSPWLALAYNNRTESDLRTPGCRDADGDGYGELPDPSCPGGAIGDCSDLDALSWSPPGEARSLMLSHNRAMGVTTLTWLPPLVAGAATALSYDTLASGTASDFLAGGICVESNGADTRTIDATSPLWGRVRYYLIRAENACGPGEAGADSGGVAITARACP